MASVLASRNRNFLSSVSRIAIAMTFAVALSACSAKPRQDVTGSITPPPSINQTRSDLDRLAENYRAKPSDPQTAIAYAQALRRTDQRAQAVAVLEQASIKNPKHQALLGEYGRALADVGRLPQALDVLSRAHTPDQPDWRVLNAQGAIHDQLGNFKEARRFYQTALRIVPEEPTVLSNLGLSHILAKELPQAESVLRRAANSQRAGSRVRQNLALSLALQGKFDEAEKVAAGDLPPEEARANVTALREMIKEQQQRPRTALRTPS